MKRTYIILSVFCLLTLSGCNYGEVIKPTQEDIFARSWARSELATPNPPPLYCYRTLAKEVCYARPLPEGQDRLIGHYGPRP